MNNSGAVPSGQATAMEVFSYTAWMPGLSELRQRYAAASPYPHIVLDNFLVPEAAERALQHFPSPGENAWIHYVHVNEKKLGRGDRKNFPPALGEIMDELNSPRFLEFLTGLTGIQSLHADDTFEGGGLHQSVRGGFLNIHADFTVHPHRRTWRRRINVLVYLNKDWPDAYGGHLELWDRQVRQCVQKIAPVFNRVVIFNTDQDAFHGHPEPLACPEGRTRKSLALYYFTDDKTAFVRSTEYRARPDDGLKRVWIYADKMALRAYDAVKRRVGLDDRFVSAALRLLARRRGK